MVHEKYIQRDGKLYGPYYYESYREDGKVKKRYIQVPPKDFVSKNLHVKRRRVNVQKWFGVLGLMAVLLLVAFFVYDSSLTGKVSLDIETVYEIGEPITGELSLMLKSGELIPVSSMLQIKVGESDYEFVLSDLVSYSIIDNDFYAERVSLQGIGEGYGLLGEREIYPEVEFSFIISEVEEDSAPSGSSTSTEEVIEEPIIEEVDEEVIDEVEDDEIVEEEESEVIDEVEEVVEEESIVEEESEAEESGGSLITGAVISSDGIEGTVTKETPFEYKLKQGQSVELVSSSEEIEYEVKGNKLIVTTNYFEVEEGFGEEFLGDEGLELEIDLDALNIIAEEGDLVISLVYGDVEIVSVDEKIKVNGKKEVEEEVNDTVDVPTPSPFNETEIIVNETEISELNITEINETEIILNETEIIETNITDANLIIETLQYGAVINKPVRWKKNIKLDKLGSVTVELPKLAKNIIVYQVDGVEEVEITTDIPAQPPFNDTEEFIESNISEVSEREQPKEEKLEKKKKRFKITAEVISGKVVSGQVTASLDLDREPKFITFFKNLFRTITGQVITTEETEEVKRVIIDENATEYDIEYETPAPIAVESEIVGGKRVVISGPDEVHYENVLAYVELGNVAESKIKVYHIVNGSRVLSDFTAYDLDNNTLIDYIEWVVPHLSNQTYEIILITKADHLDYNRTFIEDVYELVSSRDGNFSMIPAGDYVRVTFEQELDNTKDITIYARESCEESILINEIEVSCEIYEKKKRIDEIRRLMG